MKQHKILDISSEIECYTTNSEIVYKTSLNFAYITIQNRKNCLKYLIRTENDVINDPKSLTVQVQGYGNITRTLIVCPNRIDKDYTIDDIMDIIIQSYSTTQ